MSDFLLRFPIDGDGRGYATVQFQGEFDRLEAIEFTLEMLGTARKLAIKHARQHGTPTAPLAGDAAPATEDDETEIVTETENEMETTR